MILLLRALVFGHVRHNRLRTLVTIVAVALGVAIALAIDLANATAVASFATSVNVISNHVNLQVLGVGGGFSDGTILRVQHLAGVRFASPAIEDGVAIGARPGDSLSGEILRVLGVDMLRPLPGEETGALGTPGSTVRGAGAADPWALVNGRGAFVSERVARTYGLRQGGRMHVLAGGRDVTLVVAGIIPPSAAGVDSSVVFVDIATAQEIFGKVGRLDRVDLVVDPASLASTAAAVRRVIPPGTRAVEPAVRTGEIRRMLRSFQLNLAALSYIALLVGMYLIYNTVAISVVQRRPEIGTLRALGARRGDIFRTFLAEGALFGTCGSLAGLALGAVLAQFSVAAVSRTVDTLYVASHADRVVYDPLVLLRVFGIGVGMALLAAAVPAREAAATVPAVAMRAAGFERRRSGVPARAALCGAALCAFAWLCTRAPAIDDVPVFGYVAGLAIIFGGSLFAPAAVAGTAHAGTAWFARRFPAARLAAGNLGSSPVRNSVAVASLMIAIAMMVAIAVLIGSFRTTVVAWANDTLKADLFVR
ncbi:MAG: ABC transporter permease, partial [Candidatus Velthaea sp.]